jgi:hypothetical protein
MQRSNLLVLKGKHWVGVEGDPLEVCIIPSASAETGGLLFAPNDQRAIRRVCSKLFVDFRGYYDGEEEVKNTLDARVELFGWPPVREAIARECDRLNSEAAQGEESADSD